MPQSPNFSPSTAHAALGNAFFDLVAPADFPQTILRHRDDRWAARIGLDTLTDAEWIAHLARFEPLPGSFPQPLALRYHGHQFRSYNPDLGDGRGFLFAQMHDLQGRPAAGPRHQRQRHHALVPLWRRTADPEGRRARSAGDRDAGGARRLHLQIAEPGGNRRGFAAQRRAVPNSQRRAGAAEPRPYPHRLVPAPGRP